MNEKKKKKSRICELKTLFTSGCGRDQEKVSATSFSGEACCTGFGYSSSKPKMVEVSNKQSQSRGRERS